MDNEVSNAELLRMAITLKEHCAATQCEQCPFYMNKDYQFFSVERCRIWLTGVSPNGWEV